MPQKEVKRLVGAVRDYLYAILGGHIMITNMTPSGHKCDEELRRAFSAIEDGKAEEDEGWGQDDCHSTTAHYFRSGKPVCGATTCGKEPYRDGDNFTGFCSACSLKEEGTRVPKWARDAEEALRVTLSLQRHQ